MHVDLTHELSLANPTGESTVPDGPRCLVTAGLALAGAGAATVERATTWSDPLVTVVGLRDTSGRADQELAASSLSLRLDESSARRLGGALDLLGAAALGATALGLLQFGVSATQIRRRLGLRRKLTDGPLLERLQRVRARVALRVVTLSESGDIDSPLVLGRSEICIPSSGFAILTDAELEAVFAHELAHLERGDGVWFPIVGLLGSMLWFHPVTRWVCVQVRQRAELACDARCVELTGDPRALALALTHVAARAAAARRVVALPTMAHPHPRQGLVARVAQLTGAAVPSSVASPRARALPMIGLAFVALISIGLKVRVADARATAKRADEHPNVAKLSREMNALAARQLLLEAELQTLSRSSAKPDADLGTSLRAREIEQELRHAREMQQWLEARLVDE